MGELKILKYIYSCLHWERSPCSHLRVSKVPWADLHQHQHTTPIQPQSHQIKLNTCVSCITQTDFNIKSNLHPCGINKLPRLPGPSKGVYSLKRLARLQNSLNSQIQSDIYTKFVWKSLTFLQKSGSASPFSASAAATAAGGEKLRLKLENFMWLRRWDKMYRPEHQQVACDDCDGRTRTRTRAHTSDASENTRTHARTD